MNGGRYEIVRPLASGGMATVYLGHALQPDGTKKPVALKVMHAQLAEQEHFVKMFLDEARLAMHVHHPNVVETLDVVDSAEEPFLVMDLVEGATLHDLLAQGRPVDAPIALRILVDLLHGLHAAHEITDADHKPLGLVHRDVSPQNVLLGADGVTKITDFGIAWAASRLATTRTGEVKGKVVYMAPEQVHGDKRVDRRADVYAVGLLMWELFTGHRHFDTEHEAVLLFSSSRGSKSKLRDVRSNVPEALSEACARALSFAPGSRFSTAQAFAAALEDAARHPDVRIAGQMEMAEAVASVNARVEDERKAAADRRAARASKLSVRPPAADHSAAIGGEPRALSPAGDSSPPRDGERASAPDRASVGTAAPAMIRAKPAPAGRSWAPVVAAVVLIAATIGYVAARATALGTSKEVPSSAPASAPPAAAPSALPASAPPAAAPSALPVSPRPASAPPSAAESASAAPSTSASSASSARPALTGRLPRKTFEPDMP